MNAEILLSTVMYCKSFKTTEFLKYVAGFIVYQSTIPLKLDFAAHSIMPSSQKSTSQNKRFVGVLNPQNGLFFAILCALKFHLAR